MNNENKIPKIIHYCWFGKKDKPDFIINCINSWKKELVDYKIIEWNEENFNINCNEFVKDAYESEKFAFVSDYVRMFALYSYGGIYLDTDVEVINSFNDYLNNDSFWGFEAGNYIATSTIGAKKHNKLIKEFIDEYKNKKFINKDGSYNIETNVKIVSSVLVKYGVELNGNYQEIQGLATIYPLEIFSPYDYRYFEDKRDNRTVAIHHYYKSWLSKSVKCKQILKKIIIKIIGIKSYKYILENK